MGKIIKKGLSTQSEIIEGVKKSVSAIKTTLGPSGKHVAIASPFGTEISRDGATVAKSITFSDPIQNMGAELVKKAATLTESSAGDGPQPLDSKVLTPKGFVNMGDLSVRDEICGTNSTVQKVLAIYPKGKLKVCELTFGNKKTGKVVRCSMNHLWTVKYEAREGNIKTKTVPVSELLVDFKKEKRNSVQHKYYVPKTKVEFTKQDIILDPYLVGLLIGDGSLSGTGNIELSLGKNKSHILTKIVLPDDCSFSYNWVEKKNYYRVKIYGLNDYLKSLGLFGTKSSSKFIPESYLYNTEKVRKEVLQGLLDTDGHLNSKGLWEYSTVSEKLCENVKELFDSLGKQYHYYSRKKDGYTKEGIIHRITQLKGYKMGEKLVDIKVLDEEVEMMCIKVSNEDSLYITDNYITTHNTSTTSLLIEEFCKKGQKAISTGSNVNEIKSGMLKARDWVTDYIAKKATPIEDNLESIRQVATISANNDPEIGNLVVESMEQVGMEGIITAELSTNLETHTVITTGLKLERGWLSPQYVTSQEDDKCVLENPYILVVGETISSINQIMDILEVLVNEKRDFLIVCDDISEVVNTTLVINNLKGAFRCCVIKGVDFGDNRRNIMDDLSVAVGATHLCAENNRLIKDAKIEDLGSAKKVVVSRTSCVIYQGEGNPDQIKARAEILRKNLTNPNMSDFDKAKFSKRLASLAGGISIIYAGGATEAEKLNRKATIEDSILASRSAIAEGYVPGGGYVFYKSSIDVKKDSKFWKSLQGDEKEGAEIVFNSLPCVLRTIAENAGTISPDVVLDKVAKGKDSFGYNAKTKKIVHLIEEGILDSAKVLRVSLENSISTASMILLIDCTLTEEPEIKVE